MVHPFLSTLGDEIPIDNGKSRYQDWSSREMELIRNFATKSIFTGEVDEDGATILHDAAMLGNEEYATKIINHYPSLVSFVNFHGNTPLHLAAKNGNMSIIRKMLESGKAACMKINKQGETAFMLACLNNHVDVATILIEKTNSMTMVELYAAFSGHHPGYILLQTTIDATLKNKKGFAAIDLLNKDGVDFPLLSTWFRREAETIQRPSDSRYVKFAQGPVEHIRNTNTEKRFISESYDYEMDLFREVIVPRNKEREMHSESLPNARNTITIVAVLIASVAFTCGVNPPGGIHQDGDLIGKATAGRTLAFKIFLVTNNIALFTSLSIVTLLVSIISYSTKSLKMFVTIAHKMMWLAVASMATAYAAAAWITMPHSQGSLWLVYTTAVISSVTLGGMFVYVSYMMVKHISKKDKLRRSMSQEKSASTTLEFKAAADTGFYSV